MNFSLSAQEICNRLRGFQPWPGAFASFRGKALSVWQAQPVERQVAAGALLVENNRLIVGCSHSALDLLEVQPEGKKRMPANAFVQGYRPQNGEKLG
jgi:methionyl-tRNA formyltransferase